MRREDLGLCSLLVEELEMNAGGYRGVPKKKWCEHCNGYMAHEYRRSGVSPAYCDACWDALGVYGALIVLFALTLVGLVVVAICEA